VTDILKQTLTGMLTEQAQRHPEKVAVTIVGENVSYADLVERSDAMARGLRGLGVRRGDAVASLAENSADQILLEFACARLGAVEVMLNTAYRGDFLTHQLKVSEPRLIVVDEHLLPTVLEVLGDVPSIRHVVVRGDLAAVPDLGRVAAVDIAELHAHSRAPIADLADPVWTDPATIQFTSGTTGPSKGAVLSQNYLCSFAKIESSIWYRSPEDTFYSCGPLFHLAAKGICVLGSIYRGVRCVQDERFSVSGYWSRVREENCNVTLMLGSMAMLLWTREPSPDEAIDTVVCIPAPPPALQQVMAERWGCDFQSNYGLSEAAPVTRSGPDIPLRPGYYRNAQATIEKYRNLWFHTGDLARVDEEDYFYFVDRKDDYLRRRGENISSYEVEAAIARHPDVLEAAVVGVASELLEDEVKAVVAVRPGSRLQPEELVRFCIDVLPYFAVPRYIELVDDLPRTPSGKVQKHRLRTAGTSESWDREKAGIVLSGKRPGR
jgi:carnitine-CoA ligase